VLHDDSNNICPTLARNTPFEVKYIRSPCFDASDDEIPRMFPNTPHFHFSVETSAGERRKIKAPGQRRPRGLPLAALVFPLVTFFVISGTSPTFGVAASPAAVGTEAKIGQLDGLAVSVKVQGPSTQDTPLQVACVFEYVEGDIFTAPPALPAAANGMVHLDQALHGLVTDLRKSGRFAGHALETLLITPPKGTIPAKRLLLIGLGDRKTFTPAFMRQVGAVGMREALRLGVTSYSHASDLKDGGIDSPTSAVADAVLTGALDALRAQRYLSERGASPPPSVRALTLLAGPAFFADTAATLQKLLSHPAEQPPQPLPTRP
jgi:hypothetical protein